MLTERVDTDIAIIGGGAAGASAAIESHALGLDTTMIVKGFVGKSGCSIFAGNLNHFASEDCSATVSHERLDEMVAFLVKLSHFVGDQEYIKASTQYVLNEFYPWAERLGLYMLRDADGNIISDDSGRSQAWAPKMGMSGTSMMQVLRRLVRQAEVRLVEQATVTQLLTDESGACCGVVAFNFAERRMLIIRAKAVILATGHSNYLSLRSTGTREGCGAGWTMASRIGAKLQNIELQWYHASDVAHPATWMRLHMYPNPLPTSQHRSRLFNDDGELFFDGNWFPRNPVPYPLQVKHLAKQVVDGRADFDGRYFTDYTHVEDGVLKDHVAQWPFLAALGIDPAHDRIENGITYHMNAGGIRVEGSTMATNVAGLFAAGSVNTLITGGLPNVIYDGRTAARAAAEAIRDVSDNPAFDDAQVATESARIDNLATRTFAGSLTPAQVKKRLRSIMWEDMNYVKNEQTMTRALERLLDARETLLPRMAPRDVPQRFDYELVDAIDAYEMVEACELQVRFSLFRQESRGPFYRDDYPHTDNIDWLKHVVGARLPDGNVALETIPVPTPYAEPEPTLVDFFETDY